MAGNPAHAGVLTDHFVVCNWNDLGDSIIRQLHASVVRDPRAVVIVTDQPENVPRAEPEAGEDPYHNVFVIPGDPTSDKILARANIAQADTAIVLSDPREGEYADTKSVLIALAIEAIEPRVHTIAELLHSRSRIHLRYTQVDEVVCVDELTEKLLAQAALTHGLSEFYTHLLTATEDTNEVYVVDVPESCVGRTYREIEQALADYEDADVILVGVQTEGVKVSGGKKVYNRHAEEIATQILTVNPPARQHPAADSPQVDRDYRLERGDRLFVIAYGPPDLGALGVPESS